MASETEVDRGQHTWFHKFWCKSSIRAVELTHDDDVLGGFHDDTKELYDVVMMDAGQHSCLWKQHLNWHKGQL